MWCKIDNNTGAILGVSKKQLEGYTEYREGVIQPDTLIDLKLVGVEFEGVMCSATAEDMWGLNSIESWLSAGNEVNFKFENGNTLLLTQFNMAEFQAVWIPFRASFF